MTTDYLFSYRAFGLNILSYLPVNVFESAQFETADVFIHEGKVPETLENTINQGVLYQSNDHEFLLRFAFVAYFIKNGNEIIIQKLSNITDSEISVFLIGTSFGALLLQRRLLPLHASTVIYRDKCFVFAGNSGSGKTTLSAALIKEGGTLLADDISVMNFSDQAICVRPAFPYLKIWNDSLTHLGLSTAKLLPVRLELQKFFLPVANFSSVDANIQSIFILNTHNKPEVEIIDLKGFDKFRALRKHTYLFRTISKTVHESNHFHLLNKIASNVPISIISRPIGEINTSKIIRSLNEYFLT